MADYNIIVFTNSKIRYEGMGETFINPNAEESHESYTSIKRYLKENPIEVKSMNDFVEDDEIRHICIDRGMFETGVDFRIEMPYFPRNTVFVKSKLSIERILKDIEEGKSSEIPYDIFSAESIKNLKPKEKKAVKSHMVVLLKALVNFMNAGYHKGLNERKIADWCANFHDPVFVYFFYFFEIKTEIKIIDIRDQFLTTPQFREMITNTIMKFVANFSVNNGLIDPSEVPSWMLFEVWGKIMDSISKM
jgi:hypothetical protein